MSDPDLALSDSAGATVRPRTGLARAASAPLLLQLLVCSFMWATSFPLMKWIGADLSPLAVAALRGLMGGGLIAAWFLTQRQSIVPRGREWLDWLVLGMTQGMIPNTLTVYALSELATGLTAIISAASPLMVAVAAHLLFPDERLTGRRILGVVTGFVGMAVLIGPAALSGGGSALGIWATVATAVSYAIGGLYVRSIPHARPSRLALGQQLFSGVPTLALVLATGGPAAFAAVPQHALELAAFGIFATALPILLYMHILRTAGPTRGSMNSYLIPFWTVLIGMAVLGERVDAREIAGGLIVITGIVIVSASRAAPGKGAPRGA